MNYNPSRETLQVFADYLKGRRNVEQFTIAELGKFLPTKAEAGRFLHYLVLVGVMEQRRGGGYFSLATVDESLVVLTDLIERGPLIYPRSPEEPLRIYGSIEDNHPEVTIEAYGCEISALPSIDTIQETETKRRIIQATTLIKPPITMDDINQWILRKFFDKMNVSDGDFSFHEKGIVVPAESFYIFSASNIAQSAARPVATLAYLSESAILKGFRELAETLVSYERRHNQGLGAFYPEATDEFFWTDYNKSVRPFVTENYERIRRELMDKVMKLWHPQILEIQTQVNEVTVVREPTKKKSSFGSLLKRLFG